MSAPPRSAPPVQTGSGSVPVPARGAVLKGVVIEGQARVLRRPGATSALVEGRSGAPGEGGARAIAPGGPALSAPEERSTFQRGYQAALQEGEAAQRAAHDAAARAGHASGLELGLAEGRARGLVEGREAGREEVEAASRAAAAAVAERLAVLDRLIAGWPAALTQRLEAAEDDMVALSHAALCRLLGERLVTREGVAEYVREAIRRSGGGSLGAGGTGRLAVHVHPRDLGALREDGPLAAWLDQHAPGGVLWVGDDRVALGGCLLRSPEGLVDARLETQLEALQEVLLRRDLEARPAPASSEPGTGCPTSAATKGSDR